jgi:hypothetical protein
MLVAHLRGTTIIAKMMLNRPLEHKSHSTAALMLLAKTWLYASNPTYIRASSDAW